MRRNRRSPKGSPPEPVMVKDVEPVSTEQYPTARKPKKSAIQMKGKKNITLVLPNVKKVDL